MAKLKVFRTAAGFHDAYVAAPSMKAALAAWGTDKDLFARGAAELVTDPALSAGPLAHPGTVIRRARGSADEQVAALGSVPKMPRRTARQAPPKKRPPPEPDRDSLAMAEDALRRIAARQADERAALAEEERELAVRKRTQRAEQKAEIAQATARIARERSAYEAALAEWRGG